MEETMNGIEITVDHDALSLKTEVMTLRDALHACRSSNKDMDPTDSSSEDSSTSALRENKTGMQSKTKPDCFVQEALYQKGATPLFKAIEEVNWREVLRITEESPVQVRTWVKSTGTQNTTFDWSLWKRLPLHEACRRQAPAWLVSALLSAYPDAAKCTTQFGELPLHLAVGCGAAPEVVNLILVSHWEGIAARDQSGRTPLEIWDECELLVDEDHRVVFDCLTRCETAYTRLQGDWQHKMETMQKQHEAAIFALNQKHTAELQRQAEKQAGLEQELHKLQKSVEMLTRENAEQDEKITGFAKVERTWLERVDSLTKSVEMLKAAKAEEQENVEALHQLVEDKDEEIQILVTKNRKLTKDMQHIMAWYNSTDEGIAKTQQSIQNMVDNYVELHGKLSRERQALQKLCAKRGIQGMSMLPPKILVQSNPFHEYDYGSDVYDDEDGGAMDEAANAAAAAASAALLVVSDPD